MALIRAFLDSRLLWLALLGALLWTGGRHAVRSLSHDSRFLARPASMVARGPAWGGEEVVHPALARLDELGPINLFDPRFEQRIRAALDEVPGVAGVGAIRRQWPARYAVELSFHRPVAVVRHGSERTKFCNYSLPVTRDAVALPMEPYRRAAERLLWIDGVDEYAPEPGSRWRSEALLDGLATLAQIAPHLESLAPLGIEVVDVSDAGDPRKGVVLRGIDGIVVRWGRPRAEVGENPVALKVRFLEIAAGHIDRVRGFELDVRYGTLFLRESSMQ